MKQTAKIVYNGKQIELPLKITSYAVIKSLTAISDEFKDVLDVIENPVTIFDLDIENLLSEEERNDLLNNPTDINKISAYAIKLMPKNKALKEKYEKFYNFSYDRLMLFYLRYFYAIIDIDKIFDKVIKKKLQDEPIAEKNELLINLDMEMVKQSVAFFRQKFDVRGVISQ